ncbi:DUF6011 domain-containing protein [Nonomuraea maritima]|uniref:DUF6011 domain-containing protein n=1 Tax=Nonomuraea maritima TaxID=683260 RepID=UPI0037205E0E
MPWLLGRPWKWRFGAWRSGRGRPAGREAWARLACELMNELPLDLDEPAAGDHIARCAACKHRLRTPGSQALGLGPDCASRLGLSPRKPVRITGVAKWRDCAGQTDLLDPSEGSC